MVGRPVTDLLSAAYAVGAGDFSRQVAEGRRDELGALARAINRMVHHLAHDLREIAASALSLVESTRTTRSPVQIVADLPPGLPLTTVDAEQIEQVIANIVLNAIQAMPAGGILKIGLQSTRAAPPAHVQERSPLYLRLHVEDEGAGIPDDVLPHLFDPFFTTKGVDEGTGLGLSISYGIVREHHGWIEVETWLGKGSRFSVYLPASRDSKGTREEAGEAV